MNRFPRLLAAALWALALAPGAPAAALVRDLGRGLSYYRVHELPADLPAAPAGKPGPCVLDLRYAKSDDLAAAALKAWIRFNASARSPVFVLENAQTSPSILSSVPAGTPGLVVLAPKSDKLAADIAVRVAPETERRAYDALEKGAPVESLLNDYPDKARFDEEYLEKEHLSDGEAPEAPDRPSPPGPLVDAQLQRAVQIHRGLLALKRL